ncbi:MAG TPA: hypothetical protein VMY38_04875 [Gemmatimonadaceae bacterium]|nr:hypothetical protein [Gemmatimonadaceae bacterium]
MSKPSRSHDALQQLLDERKRFESWIATLESRREATPEHVYKRVHADYEQRLATVRDQLTERTGEIRSSISGLKERLKQATEQETARTDELHEAELRAAVGEFTPEQWELRKREVEVDLKRFVDEKKKISDELNQLLLIIEQTTEGPSSEAPAPPEHPPVEAPAAAPPAATIAADATRVRSKTPARSRAAMHETPVPPPAEKAPVPIESLAPSEAPAPPASAPADAVAAESAAQTKDRGGHQGKRSKTPAFSTAAVDPRRENDKTLKCAECGAMNYPTEWYCESCGGELSAL